MKPCTKKENCGADLFSAELYEKIVAHYSKTTLRAVYSRVRAVYRRMNITEFSELLRGGGADLITAVSQFNSGRSSGMYMFKKLIDLAGLEVPGCLLSAAEQWKKEEVAAQLKKRETRVVNPSKLSAKDVYQLFAGQKSKSALNSRRRVLFAILSETPIRLTEMSGMKYEDDDESNWADLENSMLVIRKHKNSKKGKKGVRKIPITAGTVAEIERHRTIVDSPFLFPHIHDSTEPVAGGNIEILYRSAVKKYCSKTGTEYVAGNMGIHTLRAANEQKSMAPLLNLNISAKDLGKILENCKRLGHDPVTALQYYTGGGGDE
jgi:integrase